MLVSKRKTAYILQHRNFHYLEVARRAGTIETFFSGFRNWRKFQVYH